MDWWNRRIDKRLAYQERLEEFKERKSQAEIDKILSKASVVEQEAKSIQAKVG